MAILFSDFAFRVCLQLLLLPRQFQIARLRLDETKAKSGTIYSTWTLIGIWLREDSLLLLRCPHYLGI